MAQFPFPLLLPRLRLMLLTLASAAALICAVPRAALAAEPAAVDKESLRRAEALASEAKVFYNAGLYEKASRRYMEAFQISKRPSLVYNAARAYQEGHFYQEAIALYRHYRTLDGVNDEGRADADARIVQMEAALKAAEPKVLPKLDPKVEPKVEPKIEPKVDPKIEPKVEPKFEPKRDPKTGHLVDLNGPIIPPPPKPTPFPTVKVLAASGLVLLSGVSYLVALNDAADARAIEITSIENVNAYRAHAAAAQTWRNASAVQLAVGLAIGGWAAYDVWSGSHVGDAQKSSWLIAPNVDGFSVVWAGRF